MTQITLQLIRVTIFAIIIYKLKYPINKTRTK